MPCKRLANVEFIGYPQPISAANGLRVTEKPRMDTEILLWLDFAVTSVLFVAVVGLGVWSHIQSLTITRSAEFREGIRTAVGERISELERRQETLELVWEEWTKKMKSQESRLRRFNKLDELREERESKETLPAISLPDGLRAVGPPIQMGESKAATTDEQRAAKRRAIAARRQ